MKQKMYVVMLKDRYRYERAFAVMAVSEAHAVGSVRSEGFRLPEYELVYCLEQSSNVVEC